MAQQRLLRQIDAEPTGLATSWARVPPGASFVLWEYQGPGVRSAQDYLRAAPGERKRRVNARALGFARTLYAELKKGEPFYSDDRFVVFRRPAF